MKDIKKLIIKWEKIGFLENCKNKVQLSNIYEDLGELLIGGYDLNLKNKKLIDSIVFPTVYRIYKNKGYTFDKISLIILLKKLDDEITKTKYYEIISGRSELDVEAEFCFQFAMNYKK